MNERERWRATGRRALRVARQRGWMEPLASHPGMLAPLLAGLVIGLTLVAGWAGLFGGGATSDESPEEYFKYGSIGNEATDGIPYLVWLVLPEVFPEYVPAPGGYGAFGFTYEPGKESPVGLSVKNIVIPRIAINCAVCHSGTYRTAPEQAPILVPTAPSTRMDSLAYLRFLFRCAEDPRFTADRILTAIERRPGVKLNWIERALYRFVIIPMTQNGIRQLRERYAWSDSRPPWGP
jgi:hypothetical protein